MPTTCVSIATSGNHCRVRSPYHPKFVTFAHDHQAAWKAPEWIFDSRDEKSIRVFCLDLYGTDGSPCPTCDVQINLDYSPSLIPLFLSKDAACFWAGRPLAQRVSRDSSVRIGDSVVIVSGGFPGSGGSVKHPALAEREGTILEVRNVPVAIAELAIKLCGPVEDWENQEIPITIVRRNESANDQTKLLADAWEYLCSGHTP